MKEIIITKEILEIMQNNPDTTGTMIIKEIEEELTGPLPALAILKEDCDKTYKKELECKLLVSEYNYSLLKEIINNRQCREANTMEKIKLNEMDKIIIEEKLEELILKASDCLNSIRMTGELDKIQKVFVQDIIDSI